MTGAFGVQIKTKTRIIFADEGNNFFLLSLIGIERKTFLTYFNLDPLSPYVKSIGDLLWLFGDKMKTMVPE